MKTAILVLLSLAFSQAQAAEYFKNRKMTAKEVQAFVAKLKPAKSFAPPSMNKPANPGGPNPAPLIPIRDGRFKAEILKLEIKKNPDDTYTMSSSLVCKAEDKAPVYDGRNLTEWEIINPYAVSCATTVDGRPANVVTEGFMIMETYQWFRDEAPSDFKVGTFSLVVTEGTNAVQLSYDYLANRDLAAKSMLGNAGAESLVVCKSANDGSGDVICDALTGEFFFAGYELMD